MLPKNITHPNIIKEGFSTASRAAVGTVDNKI